MLTMHFSFRIIFIPVVIFQIGNLVKTFDEDPNRLPTKCESKSILYLINSLIFLE